jgi:hypothetical protein
MTRLSATATIAALLLLAIAQGFGATKVTAKAATKGTAKPYHMTAQNQLHFKSTRHASKALARLQSKEQQHSRGPHGQNGALSASHRAPAQARAIKARPHQANPPAGKIGFVSATQIPEGGESWGNVQAATLGGLSAFITVVNTAAGCAYSEVAANGDGTFTAPAATLTLTAYGNCNAAFVVGDLDGDGNSDIVEADSATSTVTVLMSNTDGTFTAGTPITVTGASGFTGGALVLNATSGFLDAVVVDDSAPSLLIVVPGNGDGTFGTPAAPVALLPSGGALGTGYGVILADFDGDGLIDVAENDFNSNQVNVYLAATTPTAYTGVGLVTPDGVYDGCSSTSGSLSGSVAIVETNCSDNTITVYNNDGTGAFSEGVYHPAAVTGTSNADVYPEAATIADVNGDGNGDVVVTNDDSADVTILFGDGTGALSLASVGYATGGYPFNPAIVEDLNGDGFVDILVADDNQSLVWMAGYGDGTFQASRNYYAPIADNNFAYGISIANGDFNGDGLADVVVSNCCNSTIGITVFLSNPDGSLQPGVNYGSGGHLEYVAVGDFNGDGNWDIAASDDTGAVLIFNGTGSGTFIEGPTYSVNGSFQGQLVAGAFNTTGAAGFADLAVTTWNGAPSVSVLLNDGSGGFSTLAPVALTNGGYELAAGDVDVDRNLDVVVAEEGGSQVGVLLGDGTGVLTSKGDVPVGAFPYGVALADVDGDGNLDIVSSSGSQNIAVALGAGDGTFAAAMTMPSSLVVLSLNPFYNPNPSEIQVADIDGDGVMDLVYTNSNYGTVGVLFGTGTGTATTPYFFDPVEFPTGEYAFGVNVTDVNGDGSGDAVASPDDFAGASVLINANGAGAAPNYSLSVDPGSINVSDGGTGTATITLTPVNFYNGTVTFSCTGLPLKMTCSFSPATLVPAGNFSLSTTVTITTKAPHGALRMPADPHQGRTSLLACLTGMGLFGLLLAGDWKNKRNRRVGILLGILVLGMMFSLVGCSSSTPGTPIGAQSVTITATGSDGVNNAANLTVNVF